MTTRHKDVTTPPSSSRHSGEGSSAKRRRMTTRNQPDLTFCEWVPPAMSAPALHDMILKSSEMFWQLHCGGFVLILLKKNSCQDHSNGDGGSCRRLAIPWTCQSPTGARLPPNHQEPHGLPHHERKTVTRRVSADYAARLINAKKRRVHCIAVGRGGSLSLSRSLIWELNGKAQESLDHNDVRSTALTLYSSMIWIFQTFLIPASHLSLVLSFSACLSSSQVPQLRGICSRCSVGLQQLWALQWRHVRGGNGRTFDEAFLWEPLGGVLLK